MGISVLDLSAYMGLTAVGAVTLNMLLGMLMAMRYSPVRSWPHRRFNYFRLHNLTGYVALTAAIPHVLILLFNRTTRFRIVDIVYPLHSPSQPLENTIGAVALYTVAVVVVTSYLRIQLGRRVWKALHFAVYFAAAALFWHSGFTDPDLKNSPVDWLDGGKLFIAGCLTVVVVASVVRWRYGIRKTRQVNREIKSPDQVAGSSSRIR
jgi:methionine sulfoxide reductase heme-binding subunit